MRDVLTMTLAWHIVVIWLTADAFAVAIYAHAATHRKRVLAAQYAARRRYSAEAITIARHTIAARQQAGVVTALRTAADHAERA